MHTLGKRDILQRRIRRGASRGDRERDTPGIRRDRDKVCDMKAEELSLTIIQEAIANLDGQPVYGDWFYIDGVNVCEMPEAVKERIKWALDHIYISENIGG